MKTYLIRKAKLKTKAQIDAINKRNSERDYIVTYDETQYYDFTTVAQFKRDFEDDAIELSHDEITSFIKQNKLTDLNKTTVTIFDDYAYITQDDKTPYDFESNLVLFEIIEKSLID